MKQSIIFDRNKLLGWRNHLMEMAVGHTIFCHVLLARGSSG